MLPLPPAKLYARAVVHAVMYNLQHMRPYLDMNVSRPGCWAYPDMLQVEPTAPPTATPTIQRRATVLYRWASS